MILLEKSKPSNCIFLHKELYRINSGTFFDVLIADINFMKYYILFGIFMLCSLNATARKYAKPNEQVILSFNTTDGHKMVLSKDSSDEYIVFRYGTPGKVEIEYPRKDTSSWSKFRYSFHMHPAMHENDGADFNYVSFYIDKVRYVIFDEWDGESNTNEHGIYLYTGQKQKIKDLKAAPKTVKGSLIELRNSGIEETMEDFE